MNRGEHRLEVLLANLEPRLDPVDYAFVHLAPGEAVPADLEPLATFREDEGTSLVVTAAEADAHGWENRFPCRRITLEVHSALEAVGMLAAVAARLTQAGIPSNVISAVHHDHLFVPTDRAADAMTAIERGVRRQNRQL
ncbi:MAG: ACT domain-containing protein [Halofilum sp. (in: g-proteobacteria)]|nr:ACT domain-containing protein [Halofilum sp. (in: g-proteobacteria)]